MRGLMTLQPSCATDSFSSERVREFPHPLAYLYASWCIIMHMSAIPAFPSTKSARHEMIRDLLAAESIGSQEGLRARLAERGIDVTQTTLSRDLMDLRATKIRDASGTLIYTVPDHDGGLTHDAEAANVRLARWCQLLLVTSVKVGNQLVLRTQVGAANLLASSIDAVRRDEIAGTIAGDDTILVICRSEEGAAEVERALLALAEPGALPEN